MRTPNHNQLQPCAPGTYWSETTQTTACLSCPTNMTSLQGATQCFTPCGSNLALDTSTLTCVAVPLPATDALVEQGIDPATVDETLVVSESALLEDTLGYLPTLPSGSTVVVALDAGVYPGFPEDLDVNLIIVGIPEARRQRLVHTDGHHGSRQLQAGFAVITAPDNGRHFSTTRLLSLTRVILQGWLSSASMSGGVQLTVSGGWLGGGWVGRRGHGDDILW